MSDKVKLWNVTFEDPYRPNDPILTVLASNLINASRKAVRHYKGTSATFRRLQDIKKVELIGEED